MVNKKKIRKEITIGTDPEFALIDLKSNNIVRADQYPFFNSKEATARIGSDGAGYPVELRPDPVSITNIECLADDIRQQFTRIAKWCKTKDFTICGGGSARHGSGDNMALGTHIHFGSKEFKKSSDRYGRPTEACDIAAKDNIRRLATCLDILLIPIANFFVDGKELLQRLERTYGTLGECRDQPWGIEYRTPYSFTMSPLLTKGLFSLASLIAYNYKKIIPDKNIHREVSLYYRNIGKKKEDFKALHSIYKKIKPKIIKTMTYNSPNPKLNSSILSIFSLIERGKSCKSKDILSNYNLRDVKFAPFTVFYHGVSSIRSLRYVVEKYVINKTNGDIYLYELPSGYDDSNREKKIILSKGLPEIKLYYGVEIKYINGTKNGYRYHIGFSRQTARDIYNNKRLTKILADYLNNLKLRDFN